eukprot:6472259-Amphidinium_carterae.1
MNKTFTRTSKIGASGKLHGWYSVWPVLHSNYIIIGNDMLSSNLTTITGPENIHMSPKPFRCFQLLPRTLLSKEVSHICPSAHQLTWGAVSLNSL